jgi:hypothetical protein
LLCVAGQRDWRHGPTAREAIRQAALLAAGKQPAWPRRPSAAQTGISLQTVRRRLRLRSLTPILREAFDRGALAARVAEAAARLPGAQQRELEHKLADGVSPRPSRFGYPRILSTMTARR